MSPTESSSYPPVVLPGRVTVQSPDRQIRIVLDNTAEEWWVECSPLAKPADIEAYLDVVIFRLGYELLEDSECEPESQPDGFLRIYCAPLVLPGQGFDLEVDDILTNGETTSLS